MTLNKNLSGFLRKNYRKFYINLRYIHLFYSKLCTLTQDRIYKLKTITMESCLDIT